MPVQVPTIERIPVQPETSVGRTNINIPDSSQNSLLVNSSLERAGEMALKYVRKQEIYAAQTAADSAAIEYHQDRENGLVGKDGIANKNNVGDPTPLFTNYAQSGEEKKKEILERYKDASELVKTSIARKLQDVDNKFYDRVTTLQGTKQANWESSVADNSVKIAKDDMMQSVANVDINDPNSLNALQGNINEIVRQRVGLGLKHGTVTEIKDETGRTVDFQKDPSVVYRTKKDISEGLSQAITNLSLSGKIQEAQFLSEKYADYLPSDLLSKTQKQIKKDTIDQQAMVVFNSVRGLPEEEAVKQIEKIKDPEVAKKAMNELASYRADAKRLIESSSKNAYNQVINRIIERERSGNPITDLTKLQDDMVIKQILPNVKDGKQQLAIERLVTGGPKDSDPKAMVNFQNALFSGQLKDMRPEDLSLLTSGLNKSDRNKALNWYQKLRTETTAQESTRIRSMGENLKKQLINSGYIETTFGRLDDKNQNKLTEIRNQMIDDLDKMGPMTQKEQNDYVVKLATQAMTKKAFEKVRPNRPSLDEVLTEIKSNNTPKIIGYGVPDQLSVQQKRQQVIRDFMLKNNRRPTPSEIDDLVKGK